MPYRAMFSTIITAGVALLGLAMWLWYIAPLVAATTPAGGTATTQVSAGVAPATGAHAVSDNPDRMLRGLVQGVLLLSFLLLCLLLIVGFAATFREWARYSGRHTVRRGAAKTAYVDAWKIAGERMKVDDAADDGTA